MGKRRHVCDVPQCTRERRHWQRLCEVCFKALPKDIRYNLIDAWRRKDKAKHRAECRLAGEYFTAHPELVEGPRTVTATEAYARTQSHLGERD